VAALGLQFEHGRGQLLRLQFLAHLDLRNIGVLAEGAVQVAAGEEDRA
jgi:hypothetical protein